MVSCSTSRHFCVGRQTEQRRRRVVPPHCFGFMADVLNCRANPPGEAARGRRTMPGRLTSPINSTISFLGKSPQDARVDSRCGDKRRGGLLHVATKNTKT